MGFDVIPEFCEQISRIPKKETKVDILVVSQGGDPIVPWRIIGLLRERFDEIGVIIPYAAQSAATILSFGADEIIMHPFACLGPIDPQITDFTNPMRPRTFSAEDLKCFAEFMSSDMKVSDVDFGKSSTELLSRVLDPLSIGAAKKSMKLSENLASKLLSLHMKDKTKIAGIVKEYNNKSHHGYTISRSEAKSAGLPVVYPEPKLEKLMWDVWLNIESDLNCRMPFYPPGLIIGKTNAQGQQIQSAKENSGIAILETKDLSCTCDVQTMVSLRQIMTPNGPQIDITVDIVPLGWERRNE
jgi:Periplasmic serine proteases (ClpP class)